MTNDDGRPYESSPEDGAGDRHEMGVGALLRASRERCGVELEDVAQLLRIRRPYLEAIEDCRYDDLPGKTYTCGFIRAYSEHLGLDSHEVVKRFKTEISDKENKTDLVFPVPIPESGIPGGAVLFVGLIVAVVAYGGWYLGTSKDITVSNAVPQVPGRLSASPEEREKRETVVPSPVTATAAAAAAQDAAQPETPPAPSPAFSPASSPSADEGGRAFPGPAKGPEKAEGQPSAPDGVAPAEPKVAEHSDPVLEPETKKIVAVPSEQPTAPLEAKATVKTEAKATVKTESKAAPAAVQVASVPEAAAAEGAAPETGTVYGEENKKARIIVRAKSNSWIQVRDDIVNQLVMTRLLRAGDSYRVPDRAGLKLSTGNAGGLEILVDGDAVPSIGGAGDIRKGVALDRERLRDGTAVLE